jgi:hypothetical protein
MAARPLPQSCLRCANVALVPDADSPDTVTFYECPACYRRYALKDGGSLTFRWLHPISIALYAFAFRSEPPAGHVENAARDILNLEGDERPRFVEEIQDELDHPTQQISQMLDFEKTEAECREFLVAVMERTRKLAAE